MPYRKVYLPHREVWSSPRSVIVTAKCDRYRKVSVRYRKEQG